MFSLFVKVYDISQLHQEYIAGTLLIVDSFETISLHSKNFKLRLNFF